jgi:tetratricopeptide (TPR) repeat protein
MTRFRPLLLAAGLALAGVTHAVSSDPWTASIEYEAKNDFAGAAKVLQPYVKMTQPDEFALLRTGWLAWRAGNYNDAYYAYQAALRLNSASIDARLGLSLPLMAQQRWSAAEQALRDVLQIDPLNYTANTRLMAVLEGEQQWSDLLRLARGFQRRYPSDATTLVYLARASAALGQTAAARDAWQRVLQRYPGHGEAVERLKEYR